MPPFDEGKIAVRYASTVVSSGGLQVRFLREAGHPNPEALGSEEASGLIAEQKEANFWRGHSHRVGESG